jgi:hypothetical protein
MVGKVQYPRIGRYIYVYICVCMYIYIYIHIYIYIYMYINVFYYPLILCDTRNVALNLIKYGYICIFLAPLNMDVYVCKFVYIFICVFVYICLLVCASLIYMHDYIFIHNTYIIDMDMEWVLQRLSKICEDFDNFKRCSLLFIGHLFLTVIDIFFSTYAFLAGLYGNTL